VVSHLLRIELPDVPGSLGNVATAIGLAGGNIEAIEIVEHRPDGSAVDDVFVELTGGVMPDMVVSAVQRLEGVHVLWVSRYAAGGNLHLDLEAMEMISEAPGDAVHQLTVLLPRTFRSDWAMVTELDDGVLVCRDRTDNAPDLPADASRWVPAKEAFRPATAGWPGWSEIEVAAAPLGHGERLVVFGRRGGPEILDSELARLGYFAALTASIEATALEVSP
jgi:hypothetical protein